MGVHVRAWARRAVLVAALALGIACAGTAPTLALGTPESSVTFDEPDGLVAGPGGDFSYLLPLDHGARPSYPFRGEVAWSESPFSVEVTGRRLDGTPVTVCESLEYEPGTSNWVCYYSARQQGPLPTLIELEAALRPADAVEPVAWGAVPGVRILGSPALDSRAVASDGASATLSGTRELGMGVAIYPGRIVPSSPPEGAEALCVDEAWSRAEWSCEIDTSGLAEGRHTYSARHVPIDGDPADIEFFVPSGFRWIYVDQPEPTPEPTPTPTPTPEPTPTPTPTPTPEPTPTPTPTPDPTPPIPSPTPTAAPVPDPADEPEPESSAGPVLVPPSALNPPSAAAPTEQLAPDPTPDPSAAVDPEPTEHPTSSDDPEPDSGATGAAGAAGPTPGSSGSSTTPSSYGHALTAPPELIAAGPAALGGAALTAAGFLVLVALPSELLHATLRHNYTQAFGFLGGWRRRWTTWAARATVPPWIAAGLLLAAGALIGSLATLETGGLSVLARLCLAMFLALVTTNGVGVALGWLMGTRYRAQPQLTLMPGFLLLTAASVLVSRAFGLEPAILFGVLIMTTFGGALRREQRGVLSAVVCAAFAGLGGLAWIGYGLIDPSTTGFAMEFLREYLTTLLTGAIGYCVVALLPLTFLDGQRILRWSKPVWALLYAAVIVLFLLTVVPLPSSWQEASGAALWWCGAFGAFGLASIAIWAWFRIRTPRSP
ncbi:hypothetical protein [Ruania halotolerans]|uniref:hypothetical protein n=1 Tax=Ruania halotolerans TaxID=2897773 RepID=UPI001E304BFC|nr:hypothetical protein [Ruania halotolerans]UFU07787.1 hypothetical protein LQF10_06715 [Ruania halotolerans]